MHMQMQSQRSQQTDRNTDKKTHRHTHLNHAAKDGGVACRKLVGDVLGHYRLVFVLCVLCVISQGTNNVGLDESRHLHATTHPDTHTHTRTHTDTLPHLLANSLSESLSHSLSRTFLDEFAWEQSIMILGAILAFSNNAHDDSFFFQFRAYVETGVTVGRRGVVGIRTREGHGGGQRSVRNRGSVLALSGYVKNDRRREERVGGGGRGEDVLRRVVGAVGTAAVDHVAVSVTLRSNNSRQALFLFCYEYSNKSPTWGRCQRWIQTIEMVSVLTSRARPCGSQRLPAPHALSNNNLSEPCSHISGTMHRCLTYPHLYTCVDTHTHTYTHMQRMYTRAYTYATTL